MTTAVAAAEGQLLDPTESLLLDPWDRRDEVQDHGFAEADAQRHEADQATVERQASSRWLRTAVVSVIAGVQLVWIGGLAYGVWALLV